MDGMSTRATVNGGDKTYHWGGGMVSHLPDDLGSHTVGGAVATSRMQEVQGAGRGNVKSKSRSRGKLIEAID